MALDFELNLILPHQNAAIFCRSTIEATRYLIKQRLPFIAAHLSNTLRGHPLPLNEDQPQNAYQQAFYVDLGPEQANEVVELLYQISIDEENTPTPGLIALAKTLHKEWLEMANSLDTVSK